MPDGRFAFGRVPPGRYQVRARAQTQPNGATLFATFGLAVESRDIANVTMTLQSGALLDGHVNIESRHQHRGAAADVADDPRAADRRQPVW